MAGRHRIHLETQMAHRASNYRRLLRLMPQWQEKSSFYLHCPLNSGQTLKLTLRITERSTYTLTLMIEQQLDKSSLNLDWLCNFKVRLYTDARSAEMIGCKDRQLAGWHPLAKQRRGNFLNKANYDELLGEMLDFWRRSFTPASAAQAADCSRWLKLISEDIASR